MSKQEKNDFIRFPVRCSKMAVCQTQYELTRSPSLLPLSIIIKINKNLKEIKKNDAG